MVWPLLVSGAFHLPSDCIQFQWFFGLSIIAIFFSYVIYSKTDLLPSLTFGYFAIQALYTVLYSKNPYQYDILNTDIWLYSCMSLICFVGMAAFAFNLDIIDEWHLNTILPIFAVVNSLYVIAGALSYWLIGVCDLRLDNTLHPGFFYPLCKIRGAYLYTRIFGSGILTEGVGFSGFLNYSGMNANLICLSMPFLLKKNKVNFVSIILCVIAIVLSKSSIPYGVLALMIAAFVVCKTRLAKKLIIVTSIIPMFFGLLVEKQHLFDAAYRFQAYKIFMGSWWRHSNKIIGTGLGTFPIIERSIQCNLGFMCSPKTGVFYWSSLHSDWLQILFEGGVIGLILSVALFVDSSRKLYLKGRAELFSLLIGIGASAIFDFPLRYMVISFLAAFCVSSAYLEDNKAL